MKIPMQVGAELRLTPRGEVRLDNPEIELAEGGSADAVLLYRFDEKSGEHILRLLEPVADHEHEKDHRPDD
jgi:hypothetical protein